MNGNNGLELPLQVNIDKQNDIINNLKNNDTESRG